jgi:hypothetical protein
MFTHSERSEMRFRNLPGFVILLLFSLLISTACATIEAGLEGVSQTSVTPETQPNIEEVVTQEANTKPSATDTAQIPEPTAETNSAESDSEISGYWVEVSDERTGIRFAMPCFWNADIPLPQQDPTGLGAFPVKNYTEEYVMGFGPKQGDLIWDNGAIKIDILPLNADQWGFPPGTSLQDFTFGLPRGEDDKVQEIEEVNVNGQPALLVTTFDSLRETTFLSYYFGLPNDIFLIFSAYPQSTIDHPDVQAILNSLALTSDVEIHIPDYPPGPPPNGIQAACLNGLEFASQQESTPGTQTCDTALEGTLEAVTCNFQSALLYKDLEALEKLMSDPFVIGYWQSEGRIGSPAEIIPELANYLEAVDTSELSFTSDRSHFPDLDGIAVDSLFGPQSNPAAVIYSQGWGQDGQGAALLYINQNALGEYHWYGMVYALQGF